MTDEDLIELGMDEQHVARDAAVAELLARDRARTWLAEYRVEPIRAQIAELKKGGR